MTASFSYRKKRRQRMLDKLAKMRSAKERKRMEREPVEEEPRMERWNRFEIVVRDRLTGETGCFELRSLRDAGKRLAAVVRWYC
jgi:hypothetical protein